MVGGREGFTGGGDEGREVAAGRKKEREEWEGSGI